MLLAICVRCGELAEILCHYGRDKDRPMCYLCYHKTYREEHKEKSKAYYRKNKEKILARRRERKRLKEGASE